MVKTDTVSVNQAVGPDVLHLDASAEIQRITDVISDQVLRKLRRRGVVMGVSGGVDSSVCLALCERALGPDRVLSLMMPEADSDPESLRLGHLIADTCGVQGIVEDIAPILIGAGCYTRRDYFIRQVVPEFGDDWKCKIVLHPEGQSNSGYNIFWLVTQSPDGQQKKVRLPLESYLGIVASTNMKQRTRKQVEYFHADRLNYAVVGTPNRLEYDQGFFVKNGDGAADIKPIAHLYKTQVYQLAEALGIPDEIRRRPPTTDTYSLPQSQEEFYFTLPYDKMDLCLWGVNHDIAPAEMADAIGVSEPQIQRVYRDIQSKRRATAYQHAGPLLVSDVSEICHIS